MMIAVTGASGLVGSAICRRLHQLGIEFFGISRSNAEKSQWTHFRIDLSRKGNLADEIPCKPSTIIHLAAAIPQKKGLLDTVSLGQTNVQINARVQEAADVWGSHVVFFSTTSLYDLRSPEFHSEGEWLEPGASPYLASKLAGEKLFANRDSTIFRIPSPVGDTLESEQNVLQRFVQLAKSGKKIPLWGSGTREQDFISTDDIVAAVLCSIEQSPVGIFNIASSSPTKMADLAQAVIDVTGTGRIDFVDTNDPLEGEFARFSIRKAKAMLGWAPAKSLDEILHELSDFT